MSDQPLRVLAAQKNEIGECQDDLAAQARFLRRFVERHNTLAQKAMETYLRGIHDGLSWGEQRVEEITQYDDHDALYDPRRVRDNRLAELLAVVANEGQGGNWGNVRVNLEQALERAQELDDPDDETGVDA